MPELNWYDIDGSQTVNGLTTNIFASLLDKTEDGAKAQFWKRFPYGKIERIHKLDMPNLVDRG